MKLIAKNKNASYRYEIKDTYIAGMQLKGSEVKSIINGSIDINQAYIRINKHNECFLINAYVGHWQVNYYDHEQRRNRKLLLNKNEILRITKEIKEKRLILIPISIHLQGSLIKLKIGLGKTLNKFDKRQKIKQKDLDRLNK